MTRLNTVVLAVSLAWAGPGIAGSAQDAERLGKDLSPLGAEKAANKDGTIPAWQRDVPQGPGWTYGQSRLDAWRHKGEKAKFAIDASNVGKYADKLSPGQTQLIKQTKGYRMDVYPTYRSCGSPEFVAENTRKNAVSARLAADGWGLQQATMPGIPFPIPSNGAEAMWNAKLRYRGVGIDLAPFYTLISPRKGATEWIDTSSNLLMYLPWGHKGAAYPADLSSQVEFSWYYVFNSPTALAGQGAVVNVFLNKASESFYYFPGQRRVRRMPGYAYDAPIIGYENQYTMDQAFMFNGNLDRFDWKLVGKKEMYVPYNSFGMYDFKANIRDIVQADSVNPQSRRYELHRVWVVEATVKSGTRHIAPKRTFYLDEDSWQVLVAEDYDAQGKLWKVREGHSIPVYETGSCDNLAMTQYDLVDGRYIFDISPAGTGKDIKWLPGTNDARFKPGFYTSENLRAISER